MKKIIPALLISMVSVGAMAADGTITFNGDIKENSCKLDSAAAGALNDKIVPLANANANSFRIAGDVAGSTPFKISVSGCDMQKVKTSFEPGGQVDPVTGALKLGTRTDLQLQILNTDGQIINLTTGANNTEYVTLSGDGATKSAELNYFARYVSLKPTVAAGIVTTSVVYSMNYQ